MRKSVKKGMAMVLAAAMVFSTPVAVSKTVVKAAGTELPEAIYEYDFETTAAAKGTIKGKGTIVDSGDAGHKKVFQNAEGGKRENYFQLPETVFSANADKIKAGKGVTISFALNANKKASLYSPVFSAYGAEPAEVINEQTGASEGIGNTHPMFIIQGRQLIQYNAGGFCDFTPAQNVSGKNAESIAYMEDNKWHNVTVTVTDSKAVYYVDGKVANAWNYTADGVVGDGFLSADGLGLLKVVCLGGNQAWTWDDNDPAYQFDDVKIYAEALDQIQVLKLVTGEDVSDIVETTVSGGAVAVKDGKLEFEFVAEDYDAEKGVPISVNNKVTVVSGSALSVAEDGKTVKYVYTPEEDGTYKFAVSQTVTDDNVLYKVSGKAEAEISVVTVGNALYESDDSLITGTPSVSKTDNEKVFKISWTAAAGATVNAVVTDKDKKEVAKLTAPGNVTVSAEGTYTVTVTAIKDGKAKVAANTFTCKAAATPDPAKKDKFSNITAKPVQKYTFDDAKEVTLSSKATVKNGVLNLAPSADKHGEYYAKIDSMTAEDFSKGITFIADINPTAYASDWTSIATFGDGKPAQAGAKGATYRWAITQGFTSIAGQIGDGKDDKSTGYFGNEISAPYTWDYFNTAANRGKWYTIAVTVKKNEMITYVNGVQVQKGTKDYTEIINGMKKSNSNYLGASYWDADFDFAGSMDDVAVYDTALSAADVKKLNRGAQGGDINPPNKPPVNNAKVSKVSIKVPNRKAGKTIYVKKGDKVTLKATVTGTGSYSKSVTWKSSKTKVATVKNGKVTAKKAGTAKITATSKTDKTKKATITIKVSKKAVKNKKLKISPAKKTLKKGKSLTIKIKKMTKKTTDKITYKSSKKSVATVDAYGKVKAKKKGKATITVKCGKKKAKLKLTVKK